jgi:nucleoside-diphosphate-sugar epimerase
MRILITGANGFLGGKIIKKLLTDTDLEVIAVASSEEKISEMADREAIDNRSRIHFLSNEDFLKAETVLEDVCGAVHLAFARRVRPAAEIAASLDYAAAVFHKLADSGIDYCINMSSQGVYGSCPEFRTEDTAPAPESHYTMAKYASEILFNDILKDRPHHTNLRLDLVTQSQNVVRGLCKSAKEGTINLKGGKQIFSFIDGRDVAGAVVALLTSEGDWDGVYNVGWNKKRYTLPELAETIADAAEKTGLNRPVINLEENDTALFAGMDSSRFKAKTGWEPEVALIDSVAEMLQA